MAMMAGIAYCASSLLISKVQRSNGEVLLVIIIIVLFNGDKVTKKKEMSRADFSIILKM